MKHKKLSKQSVFGLGALVISIVFSMILFSFQQATYAQIEKKDKYKIVLKSRTITPSAGIESTLRRNLMTRLEGGKKKHVFLQLKKTLGKEERAELEKQGIKLLKYIGSYTWYAVVTDRQAVEFTMADKVKLTPIIGKIRWIGEINPNDKVEPKIMKKGVGAYNRQPDGRVDVVVVFFPDVTADTLKAVVKRYGKIVHKPGMMNDVVVRLKERDIKRLSREDTIQWIEEVGPPDEVHNDGARGCINVEPLQIVPYNLSGTNVQVGEWDGGEIDGTHDDLSGRVTVVESVGISDHATHVAGTLGGDGSKSSDDGGTLNQWRGMATAVNFYSYSIVSDDLEPEEHNNAINTHGIDLSQNSWGKPSFLGNYRTRSTKYDNIVRGSYGRAIPIIFSAGNEGSAFNTVTPPGGTAKNTIVIGNVFSDTNDISGTSGRGPTDSGQTKPDVVAAGDESGASKIKSTVPPNTYGEKSGTSMAAPAVSGTVALMLQQYRITYFGDESNNGAPLPSTFKAILCHTAEDLTDNPGGGVDLVGPDYVYGYGLINAQEAVNAIRDKRFREGVILSDVDEDIFEFEVEPGDTELKVTLAWDDVPGTAGAADILQNDLDLVLINPAGIAFYPPWKLDPTNPDTPATRNSYATEVLADDHADHFNVLEQVVVESPTTGTWTIKIKATDLPEPYQRYSIIAGSENDDQLEGNVDIMQVLDRSGSMGGLASLGAPDTKIEILKIAADLFIQVMKPDIGNQLGLVQFNQDVFPFGSADADLSELTTARAGILQTAIVPSIVHGGCTSIGDGLTEAFNQLTGLAAVPGNDKVILLVSDGKENRPQWISDIQGDLISNNIAVYPLGLGYGSGIDETNLTDLAEATGGTFRITSDELIFLKFFLEILAGAVDWAVVTDPIGELGRDESATHPVTVTGDQSSVTFTTYWEGIDNAIDFEIIPPSGEAKIITPQIAASNSRIRYGEHPRYAFYQIDFPLSGNLAGEWAGVWTMKCTGTSQITVNQKVRFSMSAFATGGAELEVDFDKFYHLTGDRVLVNSKLSRKGKPVTGATIDVYCNVPTVGAGNILHEGKVSLDQLKKSRNTSGDIISPVDQKLKILAEQAGKDILERGSDSIELYDDGQHGDGKANDGIYANSFTATRIPGSYTFRFVASFTPTGSNLNVTREWTKSFYNEVNIVAQYSVVEARLSHLATADKIIFCYYDVKVAPKDKFGNYLGPGRPVTLTVVYPNGSKQPHTLDDNIDGTYTKEIRISQADVKTGAKMVIDVGGKTFATVEKLLPHLRWSVSLHAGTTFPIGNFNSIYNSSYMVGCNLDYHFTTQWSLVGFLGYNHFKAATPVIPNTHWWNVSANLKYEFTTNPFRPYVNAGAGLYKPKGGSIKLGVNVGLGWDYSLNPNWILELGGDYHHVFTSGSSTRFFVTHVGLIYRF